MRTTSGEQRWALALLALAWVAGIAAYGNSLAGAFQFDDYNVIVNTERVHSLAAWSEAAIRGGLRPLLNLSYTLNWLAGAGSPIGFHLVNLLIHGGATACVFALARSFAHRHLATDDADRVAGWTALLFAVHPLHSEAVTYISGRSTLMMTAFYLAALVCYSREQEVAARPRASLLMFVLAALTKETSLLLPVALLVWDWTGGRSCRYMLRRQWPFWALSLLAAALLLIHPGYATLIESSQATRDLAQNLPTQLHSSAVLAGRLFWPAALNIDPDWPILDSLVHALPEFMLFAGCLLLAIRWRKSRPWVSLALLWLLVHLVLPNIAFPRADVANERQMIWADWAAFLALAMELRRLPKTAGWLLVIGSATLLGTLAHHRNEAYRSEIALWEDTAHHSPNKARVFNNLGFALEAAGRTDEAATAYRRSLALDPLHIKAANNLERLGKRPQP